MVGRVTPKPGEDQFLIGVFTSHSPETQDPLFNVRTSTSTSIPTSSKDHDLVVVAELEYPPSDCDLSFFKTAVLSVCAVLREFRQSTIQRVHIQESAMMIQVLSSYCYCPFF